MQTDQSPTLTLSKIQSNLQHGSEVQAMSHERFDQTHELFESSSGQQAAIRDWLQQLVEQRARQHARLNVLSVGCGSGILDLPLLQAVSTSVTHLHYTAIDPNPRACQRFQRDFDALQLPNIELDLREQPIERLESTQAFHLIHAVHSLYYFDDPTHTLRQLVGMLEPGGMLAVAHAPHAELNKLASCFWNHPSQQTIWFSEPLMIYLQENLPVFEHQRLEARVDVSPCFEPDNTIGEMLLDFVTQSDSQQWPEETRQLCLAYLKTIGDEDQERVFVPHPVDLFRIDAPTAV